MVRVIIGFLISFISFSSLASTRLEASVDRSQLYESDTLSLRITGNIDMEFSLGGLMNFGRNQIDNPELKGLENDFEILDTQQNYSMQSVNGETKAQVTWTYALAPKHTGTLTIPKAKYKDAESNEIAITVLKGKAPKDANNPPTVFMEAEVDKSSVYVQEQALYTVRLYTAGRLASGNWHEPESTEAIIEPFGEQKKYYRMAYNQRYEVIERQYLIFPQKSGLLSIDAHRFDGMLIDSVNRRRLRIRESSEPLTLDIKAPPATFSGNTWLPATSLHLSEKWEGDPQAMLVGDSVTRNIQISALGLLGSALPPIEMQEQQGLKIYPDQAKTESLHHESGAQSIRIESTAIVAVSAEEIQLPEISVVWWDTVNDVERIASIPKQALNIKPNPEITNSTPQAHSQTNMSSDDLLTRGNEAATAPPPDTAASTHNQAWYTLLALILIAWASTTLFLLKRLKSQSIEVSNNTTNLATQDLNVLYKQVHKAIKNKDKDLPKHLVRWANDYSHAQGKMSNILSIQDLKQLDNNLYVQAKAFEESIYGSGPRADFDSKLLIDTLKALLKDSHKNEKEPALRPMYP